MEAVRRRLSFAKLSSIAKILKSIYTTFQWKN